MRRAGFIVGVMMLLLGSSIVLYPFVSVWRLTGEVLQESPIPDAAEVVNEDRHRWSAMFDNEFILATRTLRDTTVADTMNALAFDERNGEWQSKACCGEYDSVQARVFEAKGVVVTEFSVSDNDVQATWILGPILGIALIVPGLALSAHAHRSTRAIARRTEGIYEQSEGVL